MGVCCPVFFGKREETIKKSEYYKRMAEKITL